MTKNNDTDSAISHYYSLKPITFYWVERLDIRQTSPDDYYELTLEMEMRHMDPQDKRRLLLKFDGVVNLRLTPPQRMVLSMTQLEISSIKDMHWEGLKYSVKEVEDETISFLCHSFSASIIDAP